MASYRSRFEMFGTWLGSKHPKCLYIHQITIEMAREFALYMQRERKYAARTFNNAIMEMRMLWNYFNKEGYIKINIFQSVEFLFQDENFGVIIPRDALQKLFEYLRANNTEFFVVCCLIYYGLIRRSEITRLQMFRFDWVARVIKIPGSLTKNRKNKIVVIPDEFYTVLLELGYDKLPGEYYIASNNRNCTPGLKKIAASRISEKWRMVCKVIGYPKEYEFYALKDTGNTHMEEAGISSPAIRDQTGWKYLQQRNTYSHTTGESLGKLRNFKAGDFN